MLDLPVESFLEVVGPDPAPVGFREPVNVAEPSVTW